MKIAIIGTGFAGLASAYYLQELFPDIFFTFFDKDGLVGATSRIATGLLHPYPGKHGRLSEYGHEAYQTTLHLIDVASRYSSVPIIDKTPIEKVVIDENHFLDNHKDIVKLSHNRYLITSAATVFTENYLKGLYASIKNKELVQEKVENLNELDDFDLIIVAAGFGSKDFIDKETKLRYNKGQVLKARYRLERGVIGGGYIAKTIDPDIVHVGSTYERNELSTNPDQTVAIALMQKQMKDFFPAFDKMQFIDCKAGIRVANASNYLPVVKRLSEKTYLFTALGSRGLLYHAFYGQKLAQMVARDSK